jgi:hypothetical protein
MKGKVNLQEQIITFSAFTFKVKGKDVPVL